MGLHQTKKLLHKKEKTQPTEWEKMLANHISGKGLIFKICKKLTQLNNNNKKIQLKNGQRI